MEVKLLKDWAGHKAGSILNINDEAVLSKGLDQKVFVEFEFKDGALKAEITKKSEKQK